MPAGVVRDLLAICRALYVTRKELVDQLNDEALSDRLSAVELEPPPGSMLDLVDGFYVYTGPLSDSGLDHRADREAQVDHVIARLDAPRT